MTDVSGSAFLGDRDFIIREEGGVRTRGYVPLSNGKPLGASGVTIGAGVDLGHQTEESLRRAGVAEAIIIKVTPYLGRRRKGALSILAEAPLSLTPGEARELTDRVFDGIIAELAWRYARDSGTSFYDLPPMAQTVMADLAIQYGPNLAWRTPRFWRHVTGKEWALALAELENFGDAFASRRLREAQLLRPTDQGTMFA